MHSKTYHYICSPVAEMRLKPSEESEVVSQALFSERVNPIKVQGDWTYLYTEVDKYEGWVKTSTFCQRHTPFFHDLNVVRLAAHLYRQPDTIYGPWLTLPMESRLELLAPVQSEQQRWLFVGLPNGESGYIQSGDVKEQHQLLDMNSLCSFSQRFLGLPYTWGGRSSFGFDCSGFVQMLYRQMGIFLPRDAKDQFICDELTPIPLNQLKQGNLVFFGFDKIKIRHVGLCLNNGQFIHAVASVENAPYIRVSNILDDAWNGSGYYPYVAAMQIKDSHLILNH